MSKINAIRKKALDFVRQQNWDNAVKEYKRLAELDQSNPNVFNELGDIYLKIGKKSEAYESFSQAIDAYARVSLYNNAVAVCKKVLRLIPTRTDILTKLGFIRKKQGLVKEAESYYLSYLDNVIVDETISSSDVNQHCTEIIGEMDDSFPVLEKVFDCLTRFKLNEEFGNVLHKLYQIYDSRGMQDELEKTRVRLEESGLEPPESSGAPSQKEGAIITEENIWSVEGHSDGERIDVVNPEEPSQEETPEPVPMASGDSPAPTPGEGEWEGEYGEDDPVHTEYEQQADVTAQTMTEPDLPDTTAPEVPPASETSVGEYGDAGQTELPSEDGALPETGVPTGVHSENEEPIPTEEETDNQADAVHVSAIIDEFATETSPSVSEDDYRSHYDLGMAYLEMDLLPEAIREFQFASKSSKYQTRSMEMIGLCFLKQNQPGLAIKQLSKGIDLIGADHRGAMGIKYNLGLAYEMAGDFDKAKNAFEDVYVEDVTFRDVAKKLAKYS